MKKTPYFEGPAHSIQDNLLPQAKIKSKRARSNARFSEPTTIPNSKQQNNLGKWAPLDPIINESIEPNLTMSISKINRF